MKTRSTSSSAVGLIGAVVLLGVALVVAANALGLWRQSTAGTPGQEALPGSVGVVPQASAVQPPAALDSPDIVVVPDARAAALARLAALPGGECIRVSKHSVLAPEDVDERLPEVGGPGSWLEPRIWAGDKASAARAWKAQWAASSVSEPDVVWVEATDKGRLRELGLRAIRSPGGNQTWHIVEAAQLRDC